MDSVQAFLLSKDRSEGIIRENHDKKNHQIIHSSECASDGEGIKLSDIARNLLRNGGGLACYNIEQVEWDMELAEIRQELALDAIIPDGWDEPVTGIEQINIDVVSNGTTFDLRIELFES